MGKHQWKMVDPGFKLDPPVLKKPPRRPRKQRIKVSHEPGATGLGPRKKRKCKRCGQVGHIGRLCKEPVPMSESEDEQVPIIASSTSSRKGGKKSGTKRKKGKKDPSNEISASNLAEAIASASLTAASTAFAPTSNSYFTNTTGEPSL